MEAVTLLEEPSLYAAVMVPDPAGNWFPLTVNVAVAVPPDPTSAAEPSETPPTENRTVPVGVMPLAPETLAMRNMESVTATVRKLVMSVMLLSVGAALLVPLFQAVISL